ncbi:MAG: hypothetical protein Q4B22_12125 [Eubacteriales bacterium]|nr:hypothetical protein [Eubacteriales bacterium]
MKKYENYKANLHMSRSRNDMTHIYDENAFGRDSVIRKGSGFDQYFI